jgi:hypothetical protein
MMETAEQLDIFDAISMDSEMQHVLGIIRGRIGREQAITVAELSSLTGVGPREIRDIVKELIETHQVRIGSSLGNPAGYYMIATMDEAEQNERTLRRLGLSILTRAAAIRKLTVKEYLSRVQEEMLM